MWGTNWKSLESRQNDGYYSQSFLDSPILYTQYITGFLDADKKIVCDWNKLVVSWQKEGSMYRC